MATAELEDGSSGLDFIRSLLRYLAQTAGTDRLSATTLRQAVTRALSGGDETMMAIAEQWVQEGWATLARLERLDLVK